MGICFGYSTPPERVVELALKGKPEKNGGSIPWGYPSTSTRQESLAYMEDVAKRDPSRAAEVMYGLSQAASHFESESYNNAKMEETSRKSDNKRTSSVQHRNIALWVSGVVILILLGIVTAPSFRRSAS